MSFFRLYTLKYLESKGITSETNSQGVQKKIVLVKGQGRERKENNNTNIDIWGVWVKGENSLYQFCTFPLSLKLCQNIKLRGQIKSMSKGLPNREVMGIFWPRNKRSKGDRERGARALKNSQRL